MGRMTRDVVEGRIGRFVILVDIQGQRHALAPSAVPAICECDGLLTLLLPGGKVVLVEASLDEMARTLSGDAR